MSKKPVKVQPNTGKTSKKDHEGDFSKQIDTILTVDYISKLKSDVEKLKTTLFQWSMASGKLTFYGDYGSNHKGIIKEYLKHHHDYYQYDQFQGTYELLPHIIGINLSQIVSEDLIFKSFNLFSKAIWPVRFDSKFIARINDYNLNQIYYVLGFVYYLACGYFCAKMEWKGTNNTWGFARPIDVATIPFNRFFIVKIFRQKNIFVHVGVQKVPIIKNGIIKRYEYTNYLHFLDILGDVYVQNKNKMDERMNIFRQQIFSDIARKDHSEEIEVDKAAINKKSDYFYREIYNDYTEKGEYYQTNLTEKAENRFYPLPFKPYYMSNTEMSTMIFDSATKRWLSKDHLNYMERKKVAEYQKQISDSLIKRFVDFQSAKSLVELLTKIPNFNINLTEQEKDVIGENGNVLVIGRSGTGKTTCAILRLFSIEMLFKIRLSIYKKKYEDTVKDVRCESQDIDNTMGLHCIFLTASPVLTHQIQRYYKKLTDNIKSELQRKKKKLRQEREQFKKKAPVDITKEKVQNSQMSFEQLNESQKVEILEENIDKNEESVPSNLQRNKSAEDIEQEKEMNEEFKDISLKEDIDQGQFNEQEEDIDDLKVKFQQNIKKYHNLYDLDEKDYPGFFTVKSFIMMIDGVLPKPFFIRSKNSIINQDSNAAWHNERKGVMMIENYFKNEGEDVKDIDINDIEEEINYSDEEELEHEYLRQIQLKEKREKQNLTKKLQKNKAKQILSFEVDYDYFVVYFWPRVVKKYYSTSKIITPHLVWTEIYSTIKGSATAHQYPTQFLTQNAYMSSTSNTFLTREEKLDIYETFCQYERWKIKAGGYDIMDTVNYILNYIRFRSYEGPEIHYVMIDEVQDLPHAMVYLFSKVATYGVFYSGDTAQTIAKGVGFRFCDLKSLFNPRVLDSSIQLKAPVIKHLTINFRSHNNILQLANSIVSSIEILFPKTIDRMKKQISDLDGPKPMILPESDEELLFYVLCGGDEKRSEQGQNAIKKSPLEFGCDQVIIVRDQQSKNKIPAMLQHALCLTIYQAKGLQFNDVILFDFFAESPCSDKWSLLKSLDVVTYQIGKQEYESNISRHKMKEQKSKQEGAVEEDIEEISVNETYNKQTNSYHVKKIINSKYHNKDVNDYAELCSELKLLYTAITRPRKTLIIYDHGMCAARAHIEKIWERLNVIEIITKEVVLESNQKGSGREQTKIFNKIIAQTDSNAWKQQGLKMYSRGYFDQAMKCFERSGQKELYNKAEANKYADDATKKLIEIESERNSIKQGFHIYHEMSNTDIAKLKRNLKKQETKSIERFGKAGYIFEDLKMFKQAGQCYFSGKEFEKAFECFCKAIMYKQAAESLQMMNRYREAADYYEKVEDYLKVIECLDLINEWILILEKIHKYQHKMSQYQKQALLKKYSALALEELVYEIEFENQEEDNKPENNQVEIIQEKESDEEEEFESDEESNKQQQEDSEEDPQIVAQREYMRKQQEKKLQFTVNEEEENKMIEIKGSVYQTLVQAPNKEEIQEKNQIREVKEEVSASFSDLNESKPEEDIANEGAKSIDMSFGDLNESALKVQILQASVKPQNEDKADIISLQSSFSDLNAKYEDNMEPDLESIKSLIDPDDAWVKNSISQIGRKLHSEYSVIDDQQENYNLNVKIIKTKGNIFVQDQIMKKIINIVSIINSSVHEFFTQFKGYQSLISINQKGEEENEVDNRPEISEFQDIDQKFINIILDTLESFKLFKLCLFVCNRYHLPAKAGRYLISLGLKYSTNCASNNSVNPILLAPSSFRKIEIEKGILASIALHAIYENVNADFLKVKVTQKEEDNKKSLGLYFIQGLILEGLYKKAVFMVNPQESLKILSNFNDFEAYKSIYNQKMIKKEDIKETPEFTTASPKSKNDLEYAKMLLKNILFSVSAAVRFESVSQRYYREFSNSTSVQKIAETKIPAYLPFTKLFLQYIKEQQKDQFAILFSEMLSKGYKILLKGNQLAIFDFVAVFLVTINSEEYQELFVKNFTNDNFLELYRCAKHIELVLKKYKGANALEILEAVMFMHQCYKINHCKSMNFISDSYCFVHRTSTVANELVENTKTGLNNFAYFFQQDYNLILAKTSSVSQIISKKYEKVLVRLYKKRTNFKRQFIAILHEDFIVQQEETLLKKALEREIEILLDPKERKKIQKRQVPVKKSKEKIISYDFKCRGLNQHIVHESQSEEEDQIRDQQFYHYLPNFSTKLSYMRSILIDIFLQHSKNSKEMVEGRQLYCAGLNSYYREYVTSKGGFNLFDAIQFKKFKRVDLYAENILSVMDSLTLHAKHSYLVQILTLLMIQYKSLEGEKEFTLEVSNNELKYFQGLKFMKTKDQNSQQLGKISKDEINYLLSNKSTCIFEYTNLYVSEMNQNQLAGIICDYLQILRYEESSQYVNFSTLIISYVMNVKGNQDISDSLRIIVNNFGKYWNCATLFPLTDSRSAQDFNEKRSHLTEASYKTILEPMHTVVVINQGNLDKAIEASEFDYEVQGRILAGKKKAANKIRKWWRAKRLQLKDKKQQGSYLELAVESDNLNQAKKWQTIRDIRLSSLIYGKRNILQDINLLIRTERAKDELLSFLLTNTISSSLDFHFVLMSLNKIEECRQHYFEYCSWDKDEINEFDIEEIQEEMGSMIKTIQIWKKDEKWMREKNFSFKKKKVFEVKWMTKSIGFSNIIKKRAGLKKQEMLKRKKDLLKRLK